MDIDARTQKQWVIFKSIRKCFRIFYLGDKFKIKYIIFYERNLFCFGCDV